MNLFILVEYYSKQRTLNQPPFSFYFKGIRNQVGKDTYPQAPWQRGHLAPAHSLSSDKWAFRSTFRYTNAVPQHPSFNAGEWSKFERRIRKYAEECTHGNNGVLYLLSGLQKSGLQKSGLGKILPMKYMFLRHCGLLDVVLILLLITLGNVLQ